MHLAIQPSPWTNHFALPAGDSTRPIARAEHHAVWIVLEMIFNRLEERLGLRLVCIPPTGRIRLTGPIDLGIRGMPLAKYFPVLRVP